MLCLQAIVQVSALEQGQAVQDFILHDPRDKSRVICTVQVAAPVQVHCLGAFTQRIGRSAPLSHLLWAHAARRGCLMLCLELCVRTSQAVSSLQQSTARNTCVYRRR